MARPVAHLCVGGKRLSFGHHGRPRKGNWILNLSSLVWFQRMRKIKPLRGIQFPSFFSTFFLVRAHIIIYKRQIVGPNKRKKRKERYKYIVQSPFSCLFIALALFFISYICWAKDEKKKIKTLLLIFVHAWATSERHARRGRVATDLRSPLTAHAVSSYGWPPAVRLSLCHFTFFSSYSFPSPQSQISMHWLGEEKR